MNKTHKLFLDFIAKEDQTRPHTIARQFNLSRATVHKQLKKLLKEGKIEKRGRPPLVFYSLKKGAVTPSSTKINKKNIEEIEKNYLYISPTGELIYGWLGFQEWAKRINEERNLTKLAQEYCRLRKKIYQGIIQTPINISQKLKNTFTDYSLDGVFSIDFYSLPKFGKTKFGQLVLYAKQSQNIALIKKIADEINSTITSFIKDKKISAVAYIPHTIPRITQFLREIRNNLRINLPTIPLVKVYKNNVFVAQKTLSKLQDRIINAQETIIVNQKDKISFKNVLIIDDALGSGASMNETAKKIKRNNLVTNKIYGLVIVSSLKEFDVLREI